MPAAGILPASLPILRPSNPSLSSRRSITGPVLFPTFPTSSSSLASPSLIRMGGGPRTFPGGVSKWQWKRMQEKKAQQLLKARLCRERQLYEMRKRAELKAAISELERPWEVVERAPVLFSASADEQVKVLADRFQRPTGFDMWSERDGPQIFLSPDHLPSTRFFPKGAVHSLKPYSAVRGSSSEEGEMRYDDWIARGAGGIRGGRRAKRASESNTEEHPISYRSDSEHLVAESRQEKKEMSGLLNRHGLNLEDHEMAGGFRRRGGGRESHGGDRGSYRSLSVLPVTSSIDESAGRRSRNRNRGSSRSYSTPSVTGSGRSGHEQNGVSQFSNAKSGVTGSRIDERFSRRGGRGGRRGGFQGSYRPNSVDDGSRIEGDRDGKHRLSRDPSSSASRMSGIVGRGGGRGGYQVSYRSASDLVITGSRKTKEMGMDSRFGGSYQDYKGAYSVSMLPTADLRVER